MREEENSLKGVFGPFLLQDTSFGFCPNPEKPKGPNNQPEQKEA